MKSMNKCDHTYSMCRKNNLFIALLLSFVLNFGLSTAATITVTATNELVSDNGECSIVEAVTAANNDVASGSLPGECIAGDSGLDTIVLTTNITVNTAAVNNSNGYTALPVINSDIIIDGDGYTLQRNSALDCLADGISDPTEFRLFKVNSSGDLTLKNIILANGCVYSESAAGSNKNAGGAILNEGQLTIENSVLQNNKAYRGGVIFNDGHINEITDSIASYNTAHRSGGVIFNEFSASINTIQNSLFENNVAIDSSGSVIDNKSAITTITHSTFHANESDSSGSAAVIHNDDIIVTIENSTFSENIGTAGNGTAFWQETLSPMTQINNCTFSANQAAYGSIIFSRSTIELNNSLFHNHTGITDCYSQGGNVTGSHNISTQNNSSCQATIASNLTASTVGALQDNDCVDVLADGSCVKTHALLLGSEALDGASAGAATDQRGFTVNFGTRDIGAFEGQLEEIDLIFKDSFE